MPKKRKTPEKPEPPSEPAWMKTLKPWFMERCPLLKGSVNQRVTYAIRRRFEGYSETLGYSHDKELSRFLVDCLNCYELAGPIPVVFIDHLRSIGWRPEEEAQREQSHNTP